MKTFEISDGNTIDGTCTCGKCEVALHDSYGNVDYGQRWSEKAETYVQRNCEIARARAEGIDR